MFTLFKSLDCFVVNSFYQVIKNYVAFFVLKNKKCRDLFLTPQHLL